LKLNWLKLQSEHQCAGSITNPGASEVTPPERNQQNPDKGKLQEEKPDFFNKYIFLKKKTFYIALKEFQLPSWIPETTPAESVMWKMR